MPLGAGPPVLLQIARSLQWVSSGKVIMTSLRLARFERAWHTSVSAVTDRDQLAPDFSRQATSRIDPVETTAIRERSAACIETSRRRILKARTWVRRRQWACAPRARPLPAAARLTFRGRLRRCARTKCQCKRSGRSLSRDGSPLQNPLRYGQSERCHAEAVSDRPYGAIACSP